MGEQRYRRDKEGEDRLTSKRPLMARSLLPGCDYGDTNLGSIDIMVWPLEVANRHGRSSRQSDMMGGGRSRSSTLGTCCQSSAVEACAKLVHGYKELTIWDLVEIVLR